LRDYDDSPTRVNTAISSIEQGKELVKLTDGFHPVYEIGKYPVPILYTQTSSIDHTNQISLSGSKFYTAFGSGKPFTKFATNIHATQSDAVPATSRTIPVTTIDLGELEWVPGDITPFSSNDIPLIPTSSTYPTYALLFPLDPLPPAFPTSTNGGTFSDDYRVEGSFTFTTSTIPCKYKGGRGAGEGNFNDSIKHYLARQEISSTQILSFTLSPYIKPPLEPDNIVEYVSEIVDNCINSAAFVDAVIMMSGKSLEDINKIDSLDLVKLFIDGMLEHNLLEFKAFYVGIGLDHA
jgi:hypothetical protein